MSESVFESYRNGHHETLFDGIMRKEVERIERVERLALELRSLSCEDFIEVMRRVYGSH